MEALRSEAPTEANLVASYHIEIGDTVREIAIGFAADAETIRQSFFNGSPEAPGFAEVIKKEGVEIAALKLIDPGVK